MPRSFPASRPLQAGKLALIVATLGFGALGFVRIIPDQQLSALLAVPVVSLCLAIAIAVETLLAVVRARRADEPVTDRLPTEPAYAVVRALESGVALLAIAGFAAVTAGLPEGPMAGPGAVGFLFALAGLGVLVLAASLVRTLTEWYRHRRGDRAATPSTRAG
ncbi:MAG: hypothetical protein ACOC06_05090 [Halorubrum sp.]